MFLRMFATQGTFWGQILPKTPNIFGSRLQKENWTFGGEYGYLPRVGLNTLAGDGWFLSSSPGGGWVGGDTPRPLTLTQHRTLGGGWLLLCNVPRSWEVEQCRIVEIKLLPPVQTHTYSGGGDNIGGHQKSVENLMSGIKPVLFRTV